MFSCSLVWSLSCEAVAQVLQREQLQHLLHSPGGEPPLQYVSYCQIKYSFVFWLLQDVTANVYSGCRFQDPSLLLTLQSGVSLLRWRPSGQAQYRESARSGGSTPQFPTFWRLLCNNFELLVDFFFSRWFLVDVPHTRWKQESDGDCLVGFWQRDQSKGVSVSLVLRRS